MEDEEPDVMFVKEERSEQDPKEGVTRGGGMSLQDGFVESSTDICGVSSSPAQITVALGTEEIELDSLPNGNGLQEQPTLPKPPTDVEINIQNVVGSQPSHDLKEWDIAGSQSHHMAESSSISAESRRRGMSLDMPGQNSTLYQRPGETSLPRWVTNSPGSSQPSCSYVVDDEQDCVLVQPESYTGVQKGHDKAGVRPTYGVESEWGHGQTQHFGHFDPKININPRTMTNVPLPGVSLATLELSKNCIKAKRKSYVCTYCGKAFTGQSNLEAHLRIHTGEKPFKCDICGKLFTEAGNLKKHQRVHTGEKPFVCNRCGKRFAWICNLRTHQQSAVCGGS